ncbi:MAG: polysaccharide pyruvyl transferase family protein [Rubrivivax sp.]|nr:MAG: polysaccharide pyruvyl transferase family protein [Rubrivivax sp.]
MTLKHGLVVHRHKKEVNIGDYIQAIAVKQALGIDEYELIDREDLAAYSGPPMRVVGQGWYCHGPGAWPPAPQIDYLPFGIHINPQSHEHFLKPASMEALKRLAPIGCRDMLTYEFLCKHGVDAYFSGCLTTTIRPSKIERRPTKIYLLDASHASIGLLPKEYRSLPVESLSHLLPHPAGRVYTHEEMFALAQERLDLYYRDAAVVITTRIHALMPCVAMGVPALWVERRLLDRRLDLARRYGKPHILACPDRLSAETRRRIETYVHPLLVGMMNLMPGDPAERLKPLMDMEKERARVLGDLAKAMKRAGWN